MLPLRKFHLLHKCPQLNKILTHDKGKSTLKRILETHILLRQICEDEQQDAPADVDDPNEPNDDDQSYTTTHDEEHDSDFQQAG